MSTCLLWSLTDASSLYGLEKSVTKSSAQERCAKSGLASHVVNLEASRLYRDYRIFRSVRPPVTPPGKGRFPKMNGKEKLVANLSLNFFLDARNISDLRRRLGKKHFYLRRVFGQFPHT